MFQNALAPWHLLVVALVVIVVFGSKRLPDTARALGKSLRILKSETRAMKEDDAARTAPAGTADTPGQTPPRIVQTAPGEAASARPVRESDTPH